MELHGILSAFGTWNSMEFHGKFSMELHGRFSMELHGILSGFGTWNSMEIHGGFFFFHGILGNSLEFHGGFSSHGIFSWNSVCILNIA